jgi:hypothetical protein
VAVAALCNIVTVSVTQNGSVYRLEGTDDRCGAGADLASVIGTAFPNPDGTIGFGLNIVSTPGGYAVPVAAEISLGTLSGTWGDGAGQSGAFVLTPGSGTDGDHPGTEHRHPDDVAPGQGRLPRRQGHYSGVGRPQYRLVQFGLRL